MDNTETQQPDFRADQTSALGREQPAAASAEAASPGPSGSTSVVLDGEDPALANESSTEQEPKASPAPPEEEPAPIPQPTQPATAAASPQNTLGGRIVDTTSPWVYLILGAVVVAIVTWLMGQFHQWAPPKDPTETGVRAELWLFLAIPGATMALLGAYMFVKARRGWVLYRQGWKNHLDTALQLVPGTAIAAVGNVLPVDHVLVATWPLTPSWISLILGALVSFLLVRKFDKQDNEAGALEASATSPGSE